MMNKVLLISIGVLSATFLASCASVAYKSPSQNPPHLISGDKQEQYGWDSKQRTYVRWDYPNAFGSVPENLRITGDRLCYAGGFTKAVGYHPKATGVDGKEIVGGGYLCSGYRLKKDTN